MTYVYVALFIWMVLSFVGGMFMNGAFTISWLTEHQIVPNRSIKWGHLSNFLRALDLAKERREMPKELRRQRGLYIQALVCFIILFIVAALDFYGIIGDKWAA